MTMEFLLNSFFFQFVNSLPFSLLIKFNINHTVDADEPEVFENEQNPEQKHESDDADNIKSKPNFEVDIVRNGTTLSFTCSFLPGEPVEGEYGKWSFACLNIHSEFN